MKKFFSIALLSSFVIGCGDSNTVQPPPANTEVPAALKAKDTKEAAPVAPSGPL
jgi:hypothetical protein